MLLLCQVVCRQMGYMGEMRTAERGEFGEGRDIILMAELGCRGTEDSIVDCHFDGWGENYCGHYQDVGVICYSGTSVCILY